MILIHHYRALFWDSEQACCDMYCRFYTYYRQRQFKPVRAAHILALKHILSPVLNFDITYIVVVDDTYQSLPHVLPSKIVKRILEMMWAKIWLYLHTERKRERERAKERLYFWKCIVKWNSRVWIFTKDGNEYSSARLSLGHAEHWVNIS